MSEARVFKPGERWADLDLLREEYQHFGMFLYDVINGVMGFECTDVQLDIGYWLETGPQFRMVQAQRGQAKSTITAAYAVWRQIHDPTTRVLILSAGGDMATEISGWVIQIINHMPELECLRPDRSAGDRAGVNAFDIHHELKGPEKSPSIASVGITANLQGKRADVLIADDIESTKNSATEVQRAHLMHLSRDFSSICSDGDIIYLGTPQSIDSIYNSLPGRGFAIRIWPGRYPTPKELENYGEFLAPMIYNRLMLDPSLQTGGGPTGERGQPIDPVILPEHVLTKKEIDQGAAYFQLQHMLDTRLSDAERFPLKPEKLVVMNVGQTSAPLEINVQRSPEYRIMLPTDHPVKAPLYRAAGFGMEFGAFDGTHMFVDPAGGGENGDETAYAVTRWCAGRVYWVASGGFPGGHDDTVLAGLTAVAVEFKPSKITVEDNYGKGMFRNVWSPVLLPKHSCTLEGVWNSKQKELRIIETLEPVIGSGRLVVDHDMLMQEWASTSRYAKDKRSSYSVLFQLSRITRERKSLAHEDRLDALAGSVENWLPHLRTDESASVAKAKQDHWAAMMKNPLGDGRPHPGWEGMKNAQGIRAQLAKPAVDRSVLQRLYRRF